MKSFSGSLSDLSGAFSIICEDSATLHELGIGSWQMMNWHQKKIANMLRKHLTHGFQWVVKAALIQHNEPR